MAIHTQTQISVYSGHSWHYTVEDQNIDVGCDGCTISCWCGDDRKNTITMTQEEALAVASAIQKLFKKN